MDCKSYTSVLEKMNSFVFEEFQTKKKNPIAYTLKRGEGYDSGSFKIFLPPVSKDKELNHYLFVHEAGHIIFNHSLNAPTKEKILKDRLERVYEENINLFRNKKDFFNTFYSRIFNIAQDFEVNSKLFTKDEFNYLNKIMSAYIKKDAKGMWPEDYGFPVGETWRFYLNMIIGDLPKFIKDYKNNQKKKNKDEEEQEDENQENEDQNDQNDENQNEDSEDRDDEGDSFDEDIPDDCETSEGSDGGNPADSDEEDGSDDDSTGNSGDSSGDEDGDGQGEGSGDDEDEPLTEEEMKEIEKEVEETSEEALKERQETKNSEDKKKNGHSSDYVKYTSNRTPNITETMKYIQKKIIRQDVELKRDLLYKSNRLGDPVIRAKDIEIEIENNENFYVILDVSGSMSIGFITDVVLNFKKLSKKFGKESRIIFWNSDLVQDKSFKENIELVRGGGTDIWKAFQYIGATYKNLEKSILFVISDVEDSMGCWHRDINKLDCKKKILISLNENYSNMYNTAYPEDFDETFVTSQEEYA